MRDGRRSHVVIVATLRLEIRQRGGMSAPRPLPPGIRPSGRAAPDEMRERIERRRVLAAQVVCLALDGEVVEGHFHGEEAAALSDRPMLLRPTRGAGEWGWREKAGESDELELVGTAPPVPLRLNILQLSCSRSAQPLPKTEEDIFEHGLVR